MYGPLLNDNLRRDELVVHWIASGAEAVEVEVSTKDGRTSPVRCMVPDDGCLTVNVSTIEALAGGPEGGPLRVRVSSVRSVEWHGPDGELGFLRLQRLREVISD